MPIETAGAVTAKPSASMDIALRLALVALLGYACYKVLMPFAGILLWAIILAVIMFPLHRKLRNLRGMSNGRSALVIGTVGSALLLVPIAFAVESFASSTFVLLGHVRDGTLVVPPLPAKVAALPLVGARIAQGWAQLCSNLPETLKQMAPTMKEPLTWLAGTAAGMLASFLSFVASIIIAAIIIAYGERAAGTATAICIRATADTARGTNLATMTTATIRGVATGIIGVAFIQAVLVGIGLFAAGVPAAGAGALIALLFGIMQLPVIFVSLPAIAYVFATSSSTTATIFTIWMIAAGLSDNVLKPMLLGRGLDVPMPVILVGVIGGVISSGLIGLFTGPIVLAVGYVLFMEWVNRSSDTAHEIG